MRKKHGGGVALVVAPCRWAALSGATATARLCCRSWLHHLGLAVLRLVWVAATTHRPRSIPDLNYRIITGLVLGYVSSLAISRALDLLALRSVAVLIQPKKSVGGHQRPSAANIGRHPALAS